MVKTKKVSLNKNKLLKKKTMEYTGKKSLNKSGVWREIEFPLSKKLMYELPIQTRLTKIKKKNMLDRL